ncbi:MAG: hypothetical protein R2867_19610 [Caldilineaceae bacterium]
MTTPSNPPRPHEMLRGVVERITYHNEETGYTVAKLTPERREQRIWSRLRSCCGWHDDGR